MDLVEVVDSLEPLVRYVSEAKRFLSPDPGTAITNGSGSTPEINPQTPAPEPPAVSGGAGDSRYAKGSSSKAQKVDDAQKLSVQAEKLRRDLNYIKYEFSKLKELKEDFQTLKEESSAVDEILQKGQAFSPDDIQDKLQLLTGKVKKVKNNMPGRTISSQINEHHDVAGGAEFSSYCVSERISDSEDIKSKMKTAVKGTSAFKEFLDDFLRIFGSLKDRQTKLCLFCFSIFPENAVLTKRLLVHWWIGEGLVGDGDDERAEEILKILLSKGFIEPLMKKRKLVGFKMDPLVRLVVIIIAERAKFSDFDEMGVPTAKFSVSRIACLVKIGREFSRGVFTKEELSDPNKLRTLFNVNDPYPDFPKEIFVKLKNLNVLYLGKWEGPGKNHHIELESTAFLKGVKNMKHLQFINLGGISRISDLPSEICELPNLKIMDLSACHNLETLPKNLNKLKNLTHLDISQCYLLDHTPKEVASLVKLEVLKGFIIGGPEKTTDNVCTLQDLENLVNLRKLSISAGIENFPSQEEVDVLRKFGYLRKLTISWGAKSSRDDKKASDSTSPGGNKPKTFTRSNAIRDGTLETLELQGYPGEEAPEWMFEALKPWKKLYIRGGNMKILGNGKGKSSSFKVKILCLKFLVQLKMEWEELQKLFPRLIYLETVRCPNLSLFPCDGSGIWWNKAVKPEQLLDLGFSWSFITNSTSKVPSDTYFSPK